MPRRMGFDKLSDDVLVLALRRVPFASHGSLARVCQRFRFLILSKAFRAERLEAGLAEVCVLVAGGISGWETVTRTVEGGISRREERSVVTNECWLLVNQKWRPIAPMNEPRWSFRAVVFNGEVWVTGGMRAKPDNIEEDRHLATVEIYSPRTNSWRYGPPMRQPRYYHTAGVVGGHLIVASGFMKEADEDGGRSQSTLRTAEACDGTKWFPVPKCPRRAWHPTGCELNGMFYVFGGMPEDYHTQVLAWTERDGFEWSVKASLPAGKHPDHDQTWSQVGRAEATAAAVGGKILIIGGCSKRGRQLSVLEYDSDADAWALAPPLPAEYGEHISGAFRYFQAADFGEDQGEGRILVMHRDRFMVRRPDGEWDPAPEWLWDPALACGAGCMPYACAVVSVLL